MRKFPLCFSFWSLLVLQLWLLYFAALSAGQCANDADPYIKGLLVGRDIGCTTVQSVMRDVVTNTVLVSCGTAGVFTLLRGSTGGTQILSSEQCPFAASVIRDATSGMLMANCGDRIVIITKFPVVNLTPINVDAFTFRTALAADRVNGSILFVGGYGGIQTLNGTQLSVFADQSVCLNALALYSNVDYDDTLYAICGVPGGMNIAIFNVSSQTLSSSVNVTSCRPSSMSGAGGSVFINCAASTTSVYVIKNNTAIPLINSTRCAFTSSVFAYSSTIVYATCRSSLNTVVRIDIDPITQSVITVTTIVSSTKIPNPLAVTRDTAGNVFITDTKAVYQISTLGVIRLLYSFGSASSVDQLFYDSASSLLYVHRQTEPLVTLNFTTGSTTVASKALLSSLAIGQAEAAFVVKPNGQVLITTTYGVLQVDWSGVFSYPSTIRNCTVIASLAFDRAADQISAVCRENCALVSISGKGDSRVLPSFIDVPCSTLGSVYRDPLTNVTYFSCINGSSALAMAEEEKD